MLFQVFPEDWLPTVLIRTWHNLKQALLKVVLQQITVGGMRRHSPVRVLGGARREGSQGCLDQGCESQPCLVGVRGAVEDGWRKRYSEFILDYLGTCSHSLVSSWIFSLGLPMNLPDLQRYFLFLLSTHHYQHPVLISAQQMAKARTEGKKEGKGLKEEKGERGSWAANGQEKEEEETQDHRSRRRWEWSVLQGQEVFLTRI